MPIRRSEGCARTAYFFPGRVWKGLVCGSPFPSRPDPARPDPARPGPARPDRPFRPPRFRTENCRFGAVGFGPPGAVMGLPKAIWATRSGFAAPGAVLEQFGPPGTVLGLPKPFWASQTQFGSAGAALGLPEPFWDVLGLLHSFLAVLGLLHPFSDTRGSWRAPGKGYPCRPDPSQRGPTRPAISTPADPH